MHACAAKCCVHVSVREFVWCVPCHATPSCSQLAHDGPMCLCADFVRLFEACEWCACAHMCACVLFSERRACPACVPGLCVLLFVHKQVFSSWHACKFQSVG
eukprot:GDKI01049532.1.p3 GENE.GDKI01049532.1~~GDKI01049532.1.p3  ORF type:complete len:102 (+),score=21.45 GDKI01049532.1:345-650(+)